MRAGAILPFYRNLTAGHHSPERASSSAMFKSKKNGGGDRGGGGGGRTSLTRRRPADVRSLVPRYLKPCLTYYHGDYFATAQTDDILFAQVMVEGFLPIAAKTGDDDISGQTIVLPKLHRERCVIYPITNLHTSRSTRRKAGRYVCTINQDFDGVVRGCHRQHGINWLYPEVVAAFRSMHSKGTRGMETMLFDDETALPVGRCPVRLYSIEICNEESGKLVAGELGYTVGNIYTSLTGFTAEDSSGSVQLAVLGALLQKCGFAMWDLGMYMEYKEKLGAHNIPRDEFVPIVRRVRTEHPNVLLTLEEPRMNCKDILTGSSPMDVDQEKSESKSSQQKQKQQRQQGSKKKNKQKQKQKQKQNLKQNNIQENGKKHSAAPASHGSRTNTTNTTNTSSQNGNKVRRTE